MSKQPSKQRLRELESYTQPMILTIESKKGSKAVIDLVNVLPDECLGSEWYGTAILDFSKAFKAVLEEGDCIQYGYFNHECKYCYEPVGLDGVCGNVGRGAVRNYATCSCKQAKKLSFRERFAMRYWDPFDITEILDRP